jgi:hypothetical protein
LLDALADALYQKADLIEVWVAIGMNPADEFWDLPARQVWAALTRDAAARPGCLEKLILEVRQRRPALAKELDSVLAADVATDSWYVCADPFMSRLVGPGNLFAILNRYGLRREMLYLAKQEFPVLAIRGRPGSGRSYSRRVLQHVSEHSDITFQLVIVDAATDLRNRADANALLRKLAAKLGLQTTFDDVDVLTEATSMAQEMVGVFVGRFRHLPRANRWIFLDSLDRPHVQSDLHAAVGHLASEIEAGQLGPTRLIVTGHPGDFAPAVQDLLRQENISEISDPEVRAFFREVADDIGRRLEESELDSLVADVRARAGAGGLRALGTSASNVAHEYFGSGP